MPHVVVSRGLLMLATGLLAACAGAPPASPPVARGAPPGAVSVGWSDPAAFTEARENRRETERAREAWLAALGRHLAERAAAVLPADQRLEVEFRDIRRAGSVEPWRGAAGGEVRIVRELYPPRIVLDFRRRAADGRLLEEGRRELRDPAFLRHVQRYPDDPLGHEKQLLDDWVRKELGAAS